MNTLEYIKTRKSIHASVGVWEYNEFFRGYEYWVKYGGIQYKTASYAAKSDQWEYRLKEAIADMNKTEVN